MTTENSLYDENGVRLLVELQKFIKSFAPIDFQKARRCQMIRRAIEGQIEHRVPPPSLRVVEMLCGALVEQAALIEPESSWPREHLERLITHIASRPGLGAHAP